MSHLNPERLSALADDEPTAVEAEHLAGCARCAREVEAFRRLLRLSWQERERGADVTMHASLTSWSSLAMELRAERIIRDVDDPMPGPERVALGSRWWVRAAAAVLLVAGGLLAGRASVRLESGMRGAPVASSTTSRTGSQFVSDVNPAGFRSVEDAQAVLARADSLYRAATLFLATNDTTTRQFRNSDVYRARLAALDAMAGVARQAVGEVPHDPVLNQYYLSTLAAREATLRQLDNALPTGSRLTGF